MKTSLEVSEALRALCIEQNSKLLVFLEKSGSAGKLATGPAEPARIRRLRSSALLLLRQSARVAKETTVTSFEGASPTMN